jgi:hypothetical protein
MWEHLRNHNPDPDALTELVAWADPSFAQQLVPAIDASSYGVDDWVRALLALRHWVAARGGTARAEDALGYVSCCASIAGGKTPRLPLGYVVEDMLNNYGFEAAGIAGAGVKS